MKFRVHLTFWHTTGFHMRELFCVLASSYATTSACGERRTQGPRLLCSIPGLEVPPSIGNLLCRPGWLARQLVLYLARGRTNRSSEVPRQQARPTINRLYDGHCSRRVKFCVAAYGTRFPIERCCELVRFPWPPALRWCSTPCLQRVRSRRWVLTRLRPAFAALSGALMQRPPSPKNASLPRHTVIFCFSFQLFFGVLVASQLQLLL